MEFHDLGGLNCLMKNVSRCGTTCVPVDHVAFISQSIAAGLKFLHDMGIVHKRLKPENILHNTMGEVKLTDVVQSYEPEFDCMALPVRMYASPEQCLGSDCGPEEDIWSLGLVLHELVTGTFPYIGNSYMELVQMVTCMPEPRLDPALFPAPLCDLVARCLTRERAQHLLQEEQQEVEDVVVLTFDAEASSVPAHVLVQSLAGEQVLRCQFNETLRASDLAALLHETDVRRHGSFKLVHQGRVLQPSEFICGGSEGVPINITIVSSSTTAQCRASAAELLEHGFCCVGVSSQQDFANWLKALAA
jgi:serine/threonine protein kinase